MTGRARKQPAPRALLTLMLAIEGLGAPENVATTLNSIGAVVFSENPRRELSKRCCRLREAKPGVFRDVWRWLRTPQVVNEVNRHGAYWAWRIWCQACAGIHRGVKPHVAFGMNKPGRPTSTDFSPREDAAMYAEYLHQCEGVPSEAATERAMTFAGMTRGDRRTMQRMRNNFKSCGDSLRKLPEMLRSKYPKFKE